MIRRRNAILAAGLRLVPFAAGCVGSYFCIKRAIPPYLWIAGIWIATSAFYVATTGAWRRVVSFNVGAVILALSVGEFYCWRAAPGGAIRTESRPGYVTSHEFLGNAPQKNVTSVVSRYDGPSLLYRVSYAIDRNGWRVTPWQGDREQDAGTLAFFGCSLTFGEGVQDSETLPAQVNLQSHGRFRSYNFGFSGYGPHQMLALLDHRLEVSALPRPPVMGIYQAIPGHVYRVLGRTSWDPGPRYVLQSDGSVRFDGRFQSPLVSKGLNVLYRSFLLRRWIDLWNSRLVAGDYALYFGIVQAARREFQARYPGSDFVVIYWDNNALTPERRKTDDLLLAGFAQRGIRAVPVSRMLPGYPRDAGRYVLSADDPHPNALAYRTMARYLIENVLPAPGS